MKKILIFILLVLNAAAFIGVKPSKKIDIEPIESPHIIWYLPKRDEEVEYWMA